MFQSTSASPGRWAIFSSAPHRMFFFFGILALVLTTLFWLIDATAIFHGGRSLMAPGIADIYAHGILMTLGVFPLFISGFLLTTFPRWMSGKPAPRSRYSVAALCQGLGVGTLLAGLLLGEQIVRLGLALTALGWGLFLGELVRVFAAADARPIHAWIVLPAMTVGECLLLFLLSRDTPLAGSWPIVPTIAVWWVLLPVFVAVGHRMIPFFSNNVIPGYTVRRPRWALLLLVVLLALHPLVETGGGWRTLNDTLLCATSGALWLAWQPWKATRNRLLAVLHIGFAWLWIGALLFAVDDLLQLLGTSQLVWRAPLHALTMGLFGSLLVAMTTRVTLGHSGRPLTMTALPWFMFWGIQGGAVLRVLAGLPQLPPVSAAILVAASGTLWLAALTGWAIRFAPIYWQKRLDGVPG